MEAGEASAPAAAAADADVARSLSARLTSWQKLNVLNVVAVMWGSQHAVMKGLVDGSASPPMVNATRFVLAASCTVRWLPCFTQAKRKGPVWEHGVALGVLLFLGFATYSIGLQYTTASRSGFLLYLNVKFVPLFAYVLLGRHISKTAWAMAAVAVFGTLLLCNDGSPPNTGDLWSVAAAVTSALYILKLESSTKKCDAETLNAVTMGVVAILSICWTVADANVATGGPAPVGTPLSPNAVLLERLASLGTHWPALLYLGVICTAVSSFLQNVGQDGIPAEKASVVFAMDPVYGAIFSRILLGDRLRPLGLVGAGMISTAAVISAMDQMRQDGRRSTPGVAPVDPGGPHPEGLAIS